MSELRARLESVRERIASAAGRAGRPSSSIQLVAISKTFSADVVREAAAAGQRVFGENKLQEALPKMDATADLKLRWHLVGHLQSNKAQKAGSRFDMIHSIDDERLIRRLDEGAKETGRTVEWLVQVDLAGESTKFGARPEELPALFEAARSCAAARLVGLMILPPAVDDPELARPYFARLRGIRDELLAAGTAPDMLRELSMGMSHDFEVAVEEGATLVRVGSAIFGERDYH